MNANIPVRKYKFIMMNLKPDLIMKCLLWLIGLSAVQSHPQCLDFRPPFDVGTRLTFCSSYSSFGCCTKNDDAQLYFKFQRISSQLNARGLNGCKDYLKTLLCQRCSPYAAHLYDSESTGVERPLPGMCTAYCEDFYRSCRDAVKHLTTDQRVISSLISSISFCSVNQLSDRRYCFPEILNNTDLNREISRPVVTEEGCLCLEEFAGGLRNPLLLISPPDKTGRIFVGEQLGLVFVYMANGTRVSQFLDMRDKVLLSSRRGDERGFLGLTFHPDFKNNRKFYVYYSYYEDNGGGHHTRLSEFLVSAADPNKADMTSERHLLKIKQPFANHNGGSLFFGVDNYLYIMTGDGGSAGDPFNYAQNKRSLLGKALRIDVNGRSDRLAKQYLIPPDNPFASNGEGAPEVYAYGIRNIWRCDVDEGDPVTGEGRGRIICGDVGQSKYEEIDLVEKGKNYGWKVMEGPQCYSQSLCGTTDMNSLEPPIHSYSHDFGCSVTGGHVYRGCLNPNLNGLYIYGDFCNGNVWRLKEDKQTGRWENKQISMCGADTCFNGLLNRYERRILSFGEDFNGEIYMLTTSYESSTDPSGRVYRFVDPRRRGNRNTCRSAAWEQRPTLPPVPTEAETTNIMFETSTVSRTTTPSKTTTRSTVPATIPVTTKQPETTSAKATTSAPSTRGDVRTPKPTPKTGVNSADIAIVADTSGYLGEDWGPATDLVKQVVNAIDADKYGHHLGLLAYGLVPTYFKPLNGDNTATTLQWLDTWTRRVGPVGRMRLSLFSAGDRPKFGIYITDSKSRQQEQMMLRDADNAKDTGITLLVISLGQPTYYVSQLADRENIFIIDDAKDINSQRTKQQLDAMGKRIRGEAPITTPKPKPPSDFHWECNFDSTSGDPWCGIKQAQLDDFDWTRTSGRTPSVDTGPDDAHSNSYYIYIEASSPRREGDFAEIELPTVTRGGRYCLQAYYNMYGFHTGSLEVYSVAGGRRVRFMILKGQKHKNGKTWSHLRLNIELFDGGKVAIRGGRGTDYTGDVAVDTVSLDYGAC